MIKFIGLLSPMIIACQTITTESIEGPIKINSFVCNYIQLLVIALFLYPYLTFYDVGAQSVEVKDCKTICSWIIYGEIC